MIGPATRPPPSVLHHSLPFTPHHRGSCVSECLARESRLTQAAGLAYWQPRSSDISAVVAQGNGAAAR